MRNERDVAVSPSEAIFGFMAWLTTRNQTLTVSRSHDCVPVIEAIAEFCESQGFSQPGEGYPDNLSPYPTEPDLPPTDS